MKKKNLIIGLIVVIIIVAGGIFVFSETNNINEKVSVDLEKGEADGIRATVNGQEIKSEEVTDMKKVFESQGQEISEEEVLEELISQEVLYQKAEKEDYVPTEQEVEEKISRQLSEQGSSLDEFKQELEEQDASYEEEVENYRKQVATQDYLTDFLSGKDFEITEEEAITFYEEYSQQSEEEMPSYEEVEPQIIQFLEQEKQQEEIGKLVERLKSEADVIYY